MVGPEGHEPDRLGHGPLSGQPVTVASGPTAPRASLASGTWPVNRAAAGGDGLPLGPPSAVTVAIISTEEIANHRGRLIQDIVATGSRVLAFAPYRDDIPQAIAAVGGDFRQVAMERAGLDPLAAARDVFALAQHLRRENVGLVLTAGTRPNLIGTLAAIRAGVDRRYAMIAGLGYAYAPGNELKRRMVRMTMSLLMRRVYRRCQAVFVQNEDDLRFVREAGWVRPNQPVIRTFGSGVDLEHFRHVPPETVPLRVLLMARLLREKGVLDFAAAARIVKIRHPDVRFQLLGRFDANPRSIGEEDVAAWQAEGIVEYLGATFDVRPYLEACNLFVLPSYYREGVPRTILEALATGRAIVTTDTSGCRDTVDEGRNGYLIPPRAPEALAAAIERFVYDPTLIRSMGRESRRLAEARFDVRAVNSRIMEAMNIESA